MNTIHVNTFFVQTNLSECSGFCSLTYRLIILDSLKQGEREHLGNINGPGHEMTAKDWNAAFLCIQVNSTQPETKFLPFCHLCERFGAAKFCLVHRGLYRHQHSWLRLQLYAINPVIHPVWWPSEVAVCQCFSWVPNKDNLDNSTTEHYPFF